VPRDVLFGKFTSVGGVNETWTTPVYIFTVDFADALPTDEDQMPLDGNHHPFLGQLQQINNAFVNPQYPEIGWDVIQDMQGNVGTNHVDNENWNQQQIMIYMRWRRCKRCNNLW
jgi:hypothetical protein